MKRVGVVVLAAGGSSRMGRPKQLLPFRGQSLIRHAIGTVMDTPFRPIVVVIGAAADRIIPELDGLPVARVENPNWELGPGTSVRAAVEAVESDPEVEAAVFTLVDQPFISAFDIERLVEAHEATGRPMAAAGYAESVGVPALFARARFPELRSLPSAEGARRLLARRPDDVAVVPLPAAAIDLDTPDDYSRWARLPPLKAE